MTVRISKTVRKIKTVNPPRTGHPFKVALVFIGNGEEGGCEGKL